MANRDMPIDMEQEKVVNDAPVEVKPTSPSSKEKEDNAAVQSSFIESYLNGTDVLGNYQKYRNSTQKTRVAKELARRKAQADSEELQEAFVTTAYASEAEIQSTAQGVRESLRSIEEDADNVELQYTESAMGEDASLEEARDQAARLKMRNLISSWEEEITGGEVAVEVGKFLTVPFIESGRGIKLTGNYFGAQDEFKAMIRGFKSMPEKEQLEVLPQLKKELEEKVGNVDAINLLTSFLEPGGDEKFDRFGGEEVLFDALDALGVGAMLGFALKGAKRGVNTVKTLRELRNYEASENAAAVGVLDPEIADAMGLDDTARAANGLPFDTDFVHIERTGGMSNKVNSQLREFFDEADQTAANIINSQGFLREQAVNHKYRAQLEEAAKQKFQKEQAENIRVVSKDEMTTKFEYQVLDEDGNLTDQTYTMSFDLNNAGEFEQSTIGIIREYIGSPTAFARGWLREDVKAAQRLDYVSARINRQLTDLQKKAMEPIGLMPTPKTKASLARVDKALREGDEWKNADGSRGRVFEVDELREQFGLSNDNEISAYYRINRLYNNLWHLRNSEKRRELQTLNYKKINFSRNEDSNIGKNYDTPQSAAASISQNSIHQVYDADLDKIVDLRTADRDIISQSYGEGKTLVRMDQPYDIGGDRGLFRYALVNSDEIAELPQEVLHRKVGYTPRIYEDAAYFVKEKVPGTVDGDKTFYHKNTLRFFDNKKDAETYRAQVKEKYIAAKLDNSTAEGQDLIDLEAKVRKEADETYVTLTDREEEMLAAAAGEVSHGTSGLYTGARAQDALLFGLEGDRANRVNSFDALTRNIGNISRYVSINQWRLGMEQRWINTANEIFKRKGMEERVTKFERLPKTSESSPEVRFLNRTFDQIRDWQNFPTPEEQFFSNIMRGLYDFTSERDMKKTARLLGNFRDSDPIAAARATSFHALLGMFNPAHAWIQAQGAATSISLGFGKYLTQTLNNTTALTLLGYGAKSPQRYGLIAKMPGIDKDELAAMHNLWLKTGYEDSVLQTADHAAASKGYGMTMAAMKRVADAGLMFYRQGEFFNRRMAFTTALERWKENKGVTSIKGMADSELKDVMDDANNIMLNMTRGNRAPWQKGLPSLPTQYLQVTTKFIETATGLNQNFNKKEVSRMLMGQLALYGTAGIPIAGLGYSIASEVMGMTQEDIDNNPKIVKAINDGFWGFTAMQLMGADIELSGRGALMRGVSDFVDNWFVKESSAAEKFLGAFGSTQQRFFDSLTKRLRPMTVAGIGDIDFADIGGLLVAPVFETLSSYNNAQKAIIMERLDAAYSRSNRKVAEGFNTQEAIMQAIGFQPTKVAETWDLNDRARYVEQTKKAVQSQILGELNKFATWHPNGDYTEEDWEKHQKNLSILYNILDPDEQLETMEFIRREMTNDSMRSEAMRRYIQNMKENTVEDIGLIQKIFMGTKAVRTDYGFEE